MARIRPRLETKRTGYPTMLPWEPLLSILIQRESHKCLELVLLQTRIHCQIISKRIHRKRSNWSLMMRIKNLSTFRSLRKFQDLWVFRKRTKVVGIYNKHSWEALSPLLIKVQGLVRIHKSLATKSLSPIRNQICHKDLLCQKGIYNL